MISPRIAKAPRRSNSIVLRGSPSRLQPRDLLPASTDAFRWPQPPSPDHARRDCRCVRLYRWHRAAGSAAGRFRCRGRRRAAREASWWTGNSGRAASSPAAPLAQHAIRHAQTRCQHHQHEQSKLPQSPILSAQDYTAGIKVSLFCLPVGINDRVQTFLPTRKPQIVRHPPRDRCSAAAPAPGGLGHRER